MGNRLYIDQRPLWTPAEITTAAWFDASDLSTITGITSVTQWDDKSGNVNNLTQAVGIRSPKTGQRTINGLNAIEFADDSFEFDSAIDMIGKSVFCVFEADGASIMLGGQNTGSSPVDNYQWKLNASLQLGIGAVVNPYNGGATATLLSDGTCPACSILYTSFGANSEFRFAGNLDTASYPYSSGTWITKLIGQYTSTWQIDGAMGELIILPNEPSESDRQKMEGYLAWKWGLVSNLPVGHPYKVGAPIL